MSIIMVTTEQAEHSPSLVNEKGKRIFPAGLPVERATNLPDGRFYLCPFKGMPRDWREYGRVYEEKELRPATDSEINEMDKKTINRIFRNADESNLWPIRNKFNATERAIRRVRKNNPGIEGLEYYLALDAEITSLVNKAI